MVTNVGAKEVDVDVYASIRDHVARSEHQRGKKTRKTEYVYAASPRFVEMLNKRRAQLLFARKDQAAEAFVFGTEHGTYQASFRKQWVKLFRLAGLDLGRDKGLVWHTTRHEFISRTAEQTKDPLLTKEQARHKHLKTTERYMHGRKERRMQAAAGLAR